MEEAEKSFLELCQRYNLDPVKTKESYSTTLKLKLPLILHELDLFMTQVGKYEAPLSLVAKTLMETSLIIMEKLDPDKLTYKKHIIKFINDFEPPLEEEDNK